MCSDAQEYAAPNCQETAKPNTRAEAKRTRSDWPALAATTDEDTRQARVDSCSISLGGTRSTMNMDRNLEIKFGFFNYLPELMICLFSRPLESTQFIYKNLIVDGIP